MATAPSPKAWKDAVHQGTLIVKAEAEEKWQANWCVLDYKLNGPSVYLYKTVNDPAPHTTVGINGAKLQVYELTKTGGFAFSIERLPLPTMVFATKKKEEIMEWLRLIKSAVSTTNASLAIGGPIRPFEASGVPSISPPVSPRSVSAKHATTPAEIFAEAIVQLRAPEITAQTINSWFDGVTMTDLACTALIEAVRAQGSTLMRLTDAQVEKLPESVERPRGPADFFLLSTYDARHFVVISSGSPFVSYSSPMPPPTSPRSASPSSASSMILSPTPATASTSPPPSNTPSNTPPSPRPGGPVATAGNAGTNPAPARLSPLRAPVVSPRKVPPVPIAASASSSSSSSSPAPLSSTATASAVSTSPLSPRTRPNAVSPMKTTPSLTTGTPPPVHKEAAVVVRPSLPSAPLPDRSPRPGVSVAVGGNGSGISGLTSPAPPPAANATPPTNNQINTNAAATNPPSPRGKLKPTATPVSANNAAKEAAAASAPPVEASAKPAAPAVSAAAEKADTNSLRGNKPLPAVPRKVSSSEVVVAKSEPVPTPINTAAAAASSPSDSSASSSPVITSSPPPRSASPAPPSSLSPRQHSPRRLESPSSSFISATPPAKDGHIVSPREHAPSNSPVLASSLSGSLPNPGSSRDSASSSWRTASSKDLGRPGSGTQIAKAAPAVKGGLVFGKKNLPPTPGGSATASPIGTPPGSAIPARSPLAASAVVRGSAQTAPPSGTTRERRRYYHSDFYDSNYLHTGGMDSKTTKVYL